MCEIDQEYSQIHNLLPNEASKNSLRIFYDVDAETGKLLGTGMMFYTVFDDELYKIYSVNMQ